MSQGPLRRAVYIKRVLLIAQECLHHPDYSNAILNVREGLTALDDTARLYPS